MPWHRCAASRSRGKFRFGYVAAVFVDDNAVTYASVNGPLGNEDEFVFVCLIYPVKLFTAVIYGFSYEATVFVPGKLFLPSLMFVGKA